MEITRRLIEPFGLSRKYFPGTSSFYRGPHAKAYLPSTGGQLRDFSEFDMSVAWMAGELISTMHDLNDFYRALFFGRLLPPALLAEMHKTVPMLPEAPEAAGYGLGISFVLTPCGPAWGHDGDVWGSETFPSTGPT